MKHAKEGRDVCLAQVAKAQAQQLFKDLGDASLRELAGDKVFVRGQSYAASGAVQALEDLPPAPGCLMGVQTTVQGTELYEAEITWFPAEGLEGDCDCPHGQDGFFCKHQVAVALVWRARLGGDRVTPDPDAAKKVQAAAKRAQTRANNIETLRQFVFAQKAENLAALLWRIADWDKDLMAQLKAWHAQSVAQDQLKGGDAKAAQEAIRELLKNPKGHLEPRDCGPYLRRASGIFPIIEMVLKQSPSKARALCEDALKRLYKVGETADDSWGGEFSELIPSTTELLKRCLQADPPPASWLQSWLALADKDPWGLSPACEVVAAAGPAVQKAYSAHVAKVWHDWLASNPQPKGDWDNERRKRRLAYLSDLQHQGDEVTALEVMRSTATLADEWVQLLQWCEAHQRWREGMDFAQKAYKLHPKNGQIEALLLKAYERDGWDEEALKIRRQQLERLPHVEHYRAVLVAAERVGRQREQYRDELMAWAASREQRTQTTGWGSMARKETFTDVTVRAGWCLDGEGDWDKALALVLQSQVRCHPDLRHRLALRLPPSHNATAVRLLESLLEQDMHHAKSPYQQALQLVQEMLERMDNSTRQQWLSDLRMRYKAKRNFIKELSVS